MTRITDNEAKLEQEVEAIREQSEAVKAKKAQAQEQKEEKKEEKSASKSTSGGENSNKISAKSSKSFGKGSYSFVRKATDDPNLIYGRDFDDETIELQNVLGEMGEITIRGKVISMETREIRNET